MIGFLVTGALFFAWVYGYLTGEAPFSKITWWMVVLAVGAMIFWYEIVEKKLNLRQKREEAENKKRHEERVRKLQGRSK